MQRDNAEQDVSTNLKFFRSNGVPSDVMIVSHPAACCAVLCCAVCFAMLCTALLECWLPAFSAAPCHVEMQACCMPAPAPAAVPSWLPASRLLTHPLPLPRFFPPLQAPVRQITPNYFSDRTPTITDEESRAIVSGLKQIGLLGDDGYLLANPKDDDVSRVALDWG